jgi:purine nucleosidase
VRRDRVRDAGEALLDPELPDDLLNFHYDPLACAVAAGWDGALVEKLRLSVRSQDGVLNFPESLSGKPTRVVTGVDGARLEHEWVEVVRVVGSEG